MPLLYNNSIFFKILNSSHFSQWNRGNRKCRVPENKNNLWSWPWGQPDHGLRQCPVLNVHHPKRSSGGPQALPDDATSPGGGRGQRQTVPVLRLWKRDHLQPTAGTTGGVITKSNVSVLSCPFCNLLLLVSKHLGLPFITN